MSEGKVPKMDARTRQSLNSYNKKAYNYEETYDGQVTRQMKLDLRKAVFLKPGDKVLDVACGNGKLLSLLGEKETIETYGVDISNEMIAVAQKNLPSGKFCVSDSRKLDFPDETFDVITVSAAFHHFTHPKEFMTECIRILKPNGKLYIGEFVVSFPLRLLSNLLLPFLRSGDVKMYSQKELLKFFSDSGFHHVHASGERPRIIIDGQK